jgi:hypothetical protein
MGNPEYEALGIHPDTMTCVGVLPKREAKALVWALATNGIASVSAAQDRADKKLWHVAVQGGLAYNPGAYFASIRGEKVRVCLGDQAEQHPMLTTEERTVMSVVDDILQANNGNKVVSAAVLAHGLMVGDRATLKLGYHRASALAAAERHYGPFTEGNLVVINDLLDRRLAEYPVEYGPKPR